MVFWKPWKDSEESQIQKDYDKNYQKTTKKLPKAQFLPELRIFVC